MKILKIISPSGEKFKYFSFLIYEIQSNFDQKTSKSSFTQSELQNDILSVREKSITWLKNRKYFKIECIERSYTCFEISFSSASTDLAVSLRIDVVIFSHYYYSMYNLSLLTKITKLSLTLIVSFIALEKFQVHNRDLASKIVRWSDSKYKSKASSLPVLSQH